MAKLLFWYKNCSLAKHITNLCGFTILTSHLTSGSCFRNHLALMLHRCSQPEIERLLITWWAIWQHRNKIVWQNSPPSAARILFICNLMDGQWAAASASFRSYGMQIRTVSPNPNKWQPPPSRFLKINCDTACFHLQQWTGFGWVIRDHTSKPHDAFAYLIPGAFAPLIAEALCLR